jgi:hypothetical protein
MAIGQPSTAALRPVENPRSVARSPASHLDRDSTVTGIRRFWLSASSPAGEQ